MGRAFGIGQILAGHYELREQLGAGAQGDVFRARDLAGGPDVAVKVMNEKIAKDPVARERMSREAQILMSLGESPAALRLFGQYWTDDGRVVLVTELLRGQSLEDHLGQQPAGRMSKERVVELFGPVIDTLKYSHARGVVHRDIKPGNIFLTNEAPFIRLLDFGYAKFTRLRSFTEAGMVAGSPKYISPEAWNGQQDLDERADVYSLGVLFFRCLTGRCPFESDSLLELLRLVTKAPRPRITTPLPTLSTDLDDWLEVALAIDRTLRFQNVEALWRAFVGATSSEL